MLESKDLFTISDLIKYNQLIEKEAEVEDDHEKEIWDLINSDNITELADSQFPQNNENGLLHSDDIISNNNTKLFLKKLFENLFSKRNAEGNTDIKLKQKKIQKFSLTKILPAFIECSPTLSGKLYCNFPRL